MSLTRWLALLLVVAFSALSLALAGVGLLSWRKAWEIQENHWHSYAKTVADQIGVRTQVLKDLVETLARDPSWPEVLSSPASWQREEDRLLRMLPKAMWVRLLPPGKTEDSGTLSFADLDLAHRAETGDSLLAVHGFAASRHLALASAIRQDDRVLAIVLVAFEPAWLHQAFPTPQAGALALVQGQLTLIQRGDAELVTTEPSGMVPVPGTPWQLRYWIPALPKEDWFLQGLMVWGMAVMLTVVAFWLGWRWMRRTLGHDRETLYRLVDDLNSGIGGGSYPVMLPELQQLAQRILETYRSGKWIRTRVEPQASRPSEGLVTEEGGAMTAPVEPSAVDRDESTSVSEKLPRKKNVIPPAAIFHPCGIRGRLGEEIGPEVVRELGRAIGTEVQVRDTQALIVGRDRRAESEALAAALIEGLRASGCNVIDLGAVPAPVVYFASHHLGSRSCVVVSGGSSPAPYHGLKIVLDGEFLAGDRLRCLRQRLESGQLNSGSGTLESRDLLGDYVGAVTDDVQIGRPLKVIVDTGGGITTGVVAALLRTLGCEVEEMHSEGWFDPAVSGALEALGVRVRQDQEAELGLAFDGDGDRLAVVDAKGRWVPADRVLMLLAADALSREPGGDVVFDSECSRHLPRHVVQHGGRPVVVPPHGCHLQSKVIETQAVLGGSFAGHLVLRERWLGTDDAIYGAVRLLEILSAESLRSDELFDTLPQSVVTPYLETPLTCAEEVGEIVRSLQTAAERVFQDARISAVAGIRIDFADGWGWVRCAGVHPALRFRFEADSEETLARIQKRFCDWFAAAGVSLPLPFAEGKDHG